MAQQVHATVTRSRTATYQEMEQLAEDDAVAQEHITVEDIDDFLDEIDSVLEENAQDFVRAYVQRGGQ